MTLKDQIRESGLKCNFIAMKLDITPNYLYMCLNGHRNLSPEKTRQLHKVLGIK